MGMTRKINADFDRKVALPAIFAVSGLAIGFLIWLIYFQQAWKLDASWVDALPYVNASLNSVSAFCLIMGLRAILQKKRELHQKWMSSAFVSSSLFLVSYIAYHSLHGDTKFLAEGLIRPIYFFILISHIGLSIVTLPLIFITFYFSLTQRFAIHRKIARVTYPLWLYVSISGVLIVALLKLFNPAG